MGNLRELVGGGTLRLLIHFLLRPEQRLHFRALREQTRLGTGSLQREVARLESLGLVTRTEESGRVYYEAVPDHPSWGALRTLVREHADPSEVVGEALRNVSGIHAAFVFGSSVRGTARSDSDVDVLIVEEGMPLAEIGRATNAAEALLQRVVDVKRYTPASLADKLARGSRFLREALDGPKTWLIGSEDALASHDQSWFRSPEVQARVAEAEDDFREGRFIHTDTPEEAQTYLDSLKRSPD